jgi:hypothetical protein
MVYDFNIVNCCTAFEPAFLPDTFHRGDVSPFFPHEAGRFQNFKSHLRNHATSRQSVDGHLHYHDMYLQAHQSHLQTSSAHLQKGECYLQTDDSHLQSSDSHLQSSEYHLQTSDCHLRMFCCHLRMCKSHLWNVIFHLRTVKSLRSTIATGLQAARNLGSVFTSIFFPRFLYIQISLITNLNLFIYG